MTVITTTLPKLFLPDVEENAPKFAEIHTANLRTLEQQGVRVAIGSDSQRLLVPGELRHLSKLGVFDNATLLSQVGVELPTGAQTTG